MKTKHEQIKEILLSENEGIDDLVNRIMQLDKPQTVYVECEPTEGTGLSLHEHISNFMDPLFKCSLKPITLPNDAQWISVNDRLPEEHESVLITIDDKAKSDHVYVGWLSLLDKWWMEDGPDGIAEENVTHWMPLPEPPKQD